MSDIDTPEAPAQGSRFESRKWRLTLLMTGVITVPFALGMMSVELWAGCLLVLHLTYMGGNVGARLADGLVAAVTAALARRQS